MSIKTSIVIIAFHLVRALCIVLFLHWLCAVYTYNNNNKGVKQSESSVVLPICTFHTCTSMWLLDGERTWFFDSCSHLSSTKARTCVTPAWSNSVGNERPIVLVPFLAPWESGSHLARPTPQELQSAFPIGVCLVSTGFRIATLVQTSPLARNEFVRDRP